MSFYYRIIIVVFLLMPAKVVQAAAYSATESASMQKARSCSPLRVSRSESSLARPSCAADGATQLTPSVSEADLKAIRDAIEIRDKVEDAYDAHYNTYEAPRFYRKKSIVSKIAALFSGH